MRSVRIIGPVSDGYSSLRMLPVLPVHPYLTTCGLGGQWHSDDRRFGSSTNRGQGSPLRAWAG